MPDSSTCKVKVRERIGCGAKGRICRHLASLKMSSFSLLCSPDGFFSLSDFYGRVKDLCFRSPWLCPALLKARLVALEATIGLQDPQLIFQTKSYKMSSLKNYAFIILS